MSTVYSSGEPVKQACRGLAHAHENGIVHRDVKPANVFVTSLRTSDFRIRVDTRISCEDPVIDQDPERSARLVVYATVAKQGKTIRGFEDRGVRFVPVGKR